MEIDKQQSPAAKRDWLTDRQQDFLWWAHKQTWFKLHVQEYDHPQNYKVREIDFVLPHGGLAEVTLTQSGGIEIRFRR